jgi:hypothetical protein
MDTGTTTKKTARGDDDDKEAGDGRGGDTATSALADSHRT